MRNRSGIRLGAANEVDSVEALRDALLGYLLAKARGALLKMIPITR